jgi:hypothetical protein
LSISPPRFLPCGNHGHPFGTVFPFCDSAFRLGSLEPSSLAAWGLSGVRPLEIVAFLVSRYFRLAPFVSGKLRDRFQLAAISPFHYQVLDENPFIFQRSEPPRGKSLYAFQRGNPLYYSHYYSAILLYVNALFGFRGSQQ